MLSISTPAKQSVSETITVLSSRLNSATLLEDRRAAIRGLRSFAKEYPASIASGALRSLIGTLRKDTEDVDTVEVVLQTLLLLFHPSEDSPEASEEIVLWIADEFTQRQDNITLLLEFLGGDNSSRAPGSDFSARLLSLRILSGILSARPERTEECIFTAPLGISRLVAVLDDRREAIRTEALSLLTMLSATSTEIQKLIAFEGGFDRTFSIIAAEGSFSEGSRVVEDCLILLANLLRLNSSNQSLFRESGWVSHLARLLESTHNQEVPAWAESQRNRNIYALLALTRLFLVPGAAGTQQSQDAFWNQGVLSHTLQLAFSKTSDIYVRAEALVACADMIRGSPRLQEAFAQHQVPSLQDGRPVYVIDGLLDLALSTHDARSFDARMAACECLKAYFFNHTEIRTHFLQRAIAGHQAEADETANVLTTLLRAKDEDMASDPYRFWFASVLMIHILSENPQAKQLAMGVVDGDAQSGEEVVTSIQTMSEHLIGGLGVGIENRVTIGYLMLLATWLFEDFDAVNDFLGEGSNLQRLTQAIAKETSNSRIVQGLCALLLGIIYEFSTRDSPVPRPALHKVLMSALGREKYILYLTRLRSEPAMRDFEVLPQRTSRSNQGGLPEIYFDSLFVDFFKDNFRRLLRAIDRDPGEEVGIVMNGVAKGISREMVDNLRLNLEEKEKALRDADAKLMLLEQQLDREKAEHRHSKEAMAVELSKMATANEAAQQRSAVEIGNLKEQLLRKEDEHNAQLAALRKLNESELDRLRRRTEADTADLRATISRLEVDLMKANKAKSQDMQTAQQKFDKELAALRASSAAAEDANAKLSRELSEARDEIAKLKELVQQKEEARQNAQNELDDLLIVLNDLEEQKINLENQLQSKE